MYCVKTGACRPFIPSPVSLESGVSLRNHQEEGHTFSSPHRTRSLALTSLTGWFGPSSRPDSNRVMPFTGETHGEMGPLDLQALLPCRYSKKGTHQAARKMASTALRATQRHHHPLWIWTAEYFCRVLGGTHYSVNVAMHILSRCEGATPPTSATQYIFVMLYGTFCF